GVPPQAQLAGELTSDQPAAARSSFARPPDELDNLQHALLRRPDHPWAPVAAAQDLQRLPDPEAVDAPLSGESAGVQPPAARSSFVRLPDGPDNLQRALHSAVPVISGPPCRCAGHPA